MTKTPTTSSAQNKKTIKQKGVQVKKTTKEKLKEKEVEEQQEQELLKERRINIPDGFMFGMTEDGQHILVPEEKTYKDKFSIVSDAFETDTVKDIELPKFLLQKHFNNSQTFKEKSSVLVTIKNNTETIKKGMFKTLFAAAQKDKIKLEINWLGEQNETLSRWMFSDPRIEGIDWGSISLVDKPEESCVMIEISYSALNIDGVEGT